MRAHAFVEHILQIMPGICDYMKPVKYSRPGPMN